MAMNFRLKRLFAPKTENIKDEDLRRTAEAAKWGEDLASGLSKDCRDAKDVVKKMGALVDKLRKLEDQGKEESRQYKMLEDRIESLNKKYYEISTEALEKLDMLNS